LISREIGDFSIYPARARFFWVNPAISFDQPFFFIRSACFDPSLGQPRVNPGKQEGGAQKKSKNRRVFFSRHLAANDGGDGHMHTGGAGGGVKENTDGRARPRPAGQLGSLGGKGLR